MKRDRRAKDGMDMLLDTMCNTFGGVCFISLMVAILSAAAPKSADDAEAAASEAQLTDRETIALRNRRDSLKSAIAIQEDFVKNATTGVVTRAQLAKLLETARNNEEELRNLAKKRDEYLDELARLKTQSAYSRREAARLERLLAELENNAEKPLFDRRRAVRTPVERTLPNLRTIDVWIHRHRLYLMSDSRDVSFKDASDGERRKWECRIVPGGGVRLDEVFFERSEQWRKLKAWFGERSYVRIYSDTESFDELCLLRDALIHNKSMYNWHIHEEDTIKFVEGYDGNVE